MKYCWPISNLNSIHLQTTTHSSFQCELLGQQESYMARSTWSWQRIELSISIRSWRLVSRRRHDYKQTRAYFESYLLSLGTGLYYWLLDVVLWPATIVSVWQVELISYYKTRHLIDHLFSFLNSVCVVFKHVSVMVWMFCNSSPPGNGISAQKDSLHFINLSVRAIRKCKLFRTWLMILPFANRIHFTDSTWIRIQSLTRNTWNVVFWVADNIVWKNHWPPCPKPDVKWNCMFLLKMNPRRSSFQLSIFLYSQHVRLGFGCESSVLGPFAVGILEIHWFANTPGGIVLRVAGLHEGSISNGIQHNYIMTQTS